MGEKRNTRYRTKKINEIYPSDFARQNAKTVNNKIHNDGRGPDAEPRAIVCPHCGVDIPDSGRLTKCLECGSDNLAGVKYPGR